MATGGPGRFLHGQGGPDRGGDHFPGRPAGPWSAINRLSRPLRRCHPKRLHKRRSTKEDYKSGTRIKDVSNKHSTER